MDGATIKTSTTRKERDQDSWRLDRLCLCVHGAHTTETQRNLDHVRNGRTIRSALISNGEDTMGKILTIQCPHVSPEADTAALVINGGPLVLAMDLTILEGSIGQLVNEEAATLPQLHAWTAQPGNGTVVLKAHPRCACGFLRLLDTKDTEERLHALARDLGESLIGRPKVIVEMIETA